MTDPTLAALTEALASIKDGPYHYGAYDTKEFAAAILAHLKVNGWTLVRDEPVKAVLTTTKKSYATGGNDD